MIFDHCLGPDMDAGSISCDNMTLLVVGITHGRTKEGWYKWIKERVKNNYYGYKTPSTPPQLYTQRRLLSYRAQREAHEAREEMKTTIHTQGSTVTTVSGGRGSGIYIGSDSGISYQRGGSVVSVYGDIFLFDSIPT